MRKDKWIVYMILCRDDTVHVGCTEDLSRTLKDHWNSRIDYTRTRRPFKLVNHVVFKDKYLAYSFHKYLKTSAGRTFMRKRLIGSNRVVH